jgi:hypothetical protein
MGMKKSHATGWGAAPAALVKARQLDVFHDGGRAIDPALPPWWMIGDLLNEGERNYGQTYTKAMEETGLDYGTLRNAKWVCEKVQTSLRNDNLTFAHHFAVAPLPPADQRRFLARAGQVQFSFRNENLTFAHPFAVAPLPPREQPRFRPRAVKESGLGPTRAPARFGAGFVRLLRRWAAAVLGMAAPTTKKAPIRYSDLYTAARQRAGVKAPRFDMG